MADLQNIDKYPDKENPSRFYYGDSEDIIASTTLWSGYSYLYSFTDYFMITKTDSISDIISLLTPSEP